MEKWVYREITFLLREQKEGLAYYSWTDRDGSEIKGIDETLDFWGQWGWELVSIFPMYWDTIVGKPLETTRVPVIKAIMKMRDPNR